MPERFNSREIRAKFEARYAELIRAMNISGEYSRNPLDFGDDEEKLKGLRWANGLINETLESSPREYYIASRLAMPITERLDLLRARDQRFPSNPVNEKQIIRAIKGIEEEIGGLCIIVEFELLKSVETGEEGVGLNERDQKRWQELIKRREELLSRLPEEKRDKFRF